MNNQAIGYQSPNWGKDPYNEAEEQQANDYEAEHDRLTQLGISDLKQSGYSLGMKIRMLDVIDNIVLTSLTIEESYDLNMALHGIYKGCPTLRSLFDNHIEQVAGLAAEHQLEAEL